MNELVESPNASDDIESLRRKRLRLGRTYNDDAISEAEYTSRLQEIDRRLQSLQRPIADTIEPAAQLFEDVGKLWSKATPDERSRLIGPLFDRVYVDIEARQIAAISPAPEFKYLIDHAVERNPGGSYAIVGTEPKPQDED